MTRLCIDCALEHGLWCPMRKGGERHERRSETGLRLEALIVLVV
jgi:hypothetical protein